MLNQEQQQVVDSTAHRILCLAGAGAGKTKTLITRILRLIQCDTQPDEILVLTFTRAAALEMQQRFKAACSSLRMPNFKTFHAFCYELLCQDPAVCHAIGYTSTPSVISDMNEKQLLWKVSKQCGLPRTLLTKTKLTTKERTDKKILEKLYVSALKSEKFITYDMLAELVSKLFIEDDPCIQKYKNHYKHVFVDEFQDTDTFQASFLESFIDSDIFVVGDVLQNIYSFRGTTSDIIKGYARSDTWVTFHLNHNYRSTSQICEFANAFSTYADDVFRIPMKSDRSGETVEVISVPSKSYGNNLTAMQKCYELLQRCEGSTAILARTNRESSDISDYLDSFNVPVYDNSHELETIINAVTDESYMQQWILSDLNISKYTEVLQQLYLQPDKNIYDILHQLGYDWNLTLIDRLRRCLFTSNYIEFLEILEVLNHQIVIDNIEDIKSSEEFLEAVRSADQSHNCDTYVGTIHSVKGLEFDNVIIYGVDGPTFKLNSEDNKNLYYVGITRAKNRLWILKEE